ncbi:deleted in malignant brain tumors 1 protein-like protein [Lates japonicus]|uniref:Deleted in malignant brain tumors 1 protein-like protein n=1 Tax=Lates japonicus TaxID=270547 RepID=A0AAD3MU86_LATJO|nr:deleted in malignant brain tumors 1 protein-like protein [Lates japonicus]
MCLYSSVKLEEPSISLTSPHSMAIYSPDKISLTEGSSFSITCSTHSRYSGGVFYLKKDNMNTSEMLPSFGHSIFYLAYFKFPALESKHQGEYTCVYSVNISSMSFSSVPSKSLQLIVVVTSSSSVVAGVVVTLVVLLLVLVIGYLVWRRRWRSAGAMVQFINRLGGAIKQDAEERSNKIFDGRDHNAQVNEHTGHSHGSADKSVDVDSENCVEKVTEDLAGRVCYELEPLVLS